MVSCNGTILSHLAKTIFPLLFDQMYRLMKPLFMTKVSPNCLFSSIMQQRLICSIILDIYFYWSSFKFLDFWNILRKFQCLLWKCCHFKALDSYTEFFTQFNRSLIWSLRISMYICKLDSIFVSSTVCLRVRQFSSWKGILMVKSTCGFCRELSFSS